MAARSHLEHWELPIQSNIKRYLITIGRFTEKNYDDCFINGRDIEEGKKEKRK